MKSKKLNKRLTGFFSALADETRLQIISLLVEGDKTVNQIHKDLKENITLSAVSHQLKLLDSLNIINYEKKGREKYYSLSGNFCWCVLKDAIKHFKNKKSKGGI